MKCEALLPLPERQNKEEKNKVKKKIPATFMNARLLLVFVIMCDS